MIDYGHGTGSTLANFARAGIARPKLGMPAGQFGRAAFRTYVRHVECKMVEIVARSGGTHSGRCDRCALRGLKGRCQVVQETVVFRCVSPIEVFMTLSRVGN